MSEAALEFRGVRKAYGPVQALRNVDLTIPYGTIFGLVGPNGAGKTTLFALACGFLRADAGTVTVAGQQITRKSVPGPGALAILPQDAGFMLQLPVAAQLTYYARLAGMSTEETAREVDRVLALTQLQEIRGRSPDKLSHGQRKRVGIAQAFLGNPRIIILDEPTAGLDPQIGRDIRATIRSLREEQTIIVSSHHLGEIEDLCHEVAILDKGQIVRHERMDALVGEATEIAFKMTAAPAGEVLTALEALAFVHKAVWDRGTSRLLVEIRPGSPSSPDEAGHAIMTQLIQRQVSFIEMRIGKRLEDRYLDETR